MTRIAKIRGCHYPSGNMSPDGRPENELFDAGFLGRLERLRLLVRRIFAGHMRAERRSRKHGVSMEFADYRNYVRGDDPRRVDWNAFARLDRLFVKLHEEEEDLEVSILVDASASMRWAPENAAPGEKFLLVRQTAAALAYLALCNLDRVSVSFFDDATLSTSSASRGKSGLHGILNFLQHPPPEGGGTRLETTFRKFGARMKRHGLAIVLSDFFDPSGCEAGLSALAVQGFEIRAVQIIHPAERDPSLSGDVLLSDCESLEQEKITCNNSLLTAYRAEWQKFESSLSTFCLQRQIPFAQCAAGEPFEDSVLRLLKTPLLAQ